MAEVTHLDEKLAEVLGLAQAARAAINKVATLARQEGDAELLELLQRMEDEAAKVEQGCDVASSSRDGVRTAIAKKRSRSNRRTSTLSENSRCGLPAKKTPPSRHKPGGVAGQP
jgi:hypothetical protein